MNGTTLMAARMVRLYDPDVTLAGAGKIEFGQPVDGRPTIIYSHERDATMRAGNAILWLTGHRADLHRLARWSAEIGTIQVALDTPSIIHLEADLTVDTGQGPTPLKIAFTHCGPYAVWWR